METVQLQLRGMSCAGCVGANCNKRFAPFRELLSATLTWVLNKQQLDITLNCSRSSTYLGYTCGIHTPSQGDTLLPVA